VNRESLSFVVPLALADTGREGNDLDRLSLFLDTFLNFFDRRDLADFLIVTRPQDISALEQLVARKRMGAIVRVLDENDIVPEFRSDPPTEHVWPRPNKGWHRQQIIKLACHAHVSTEFYMTADSDILFVKPFGAATLIEDGRAILNVQTRAELEKIYTTTGMKYEVGFHTMGHGQARKLLGILWVFAGCAQSVDRGEHDRTPLSQARSELARSPDLAAALDRVRALLHFRGGDRNPRQVPPHRRLGLGPARHRQRVVAG
jgi:hypothetical protein